MVNQLFGSVVYVDSAMGNQTILDVNSGKLTNCYVNSIAIACAPSASTITLTLANTAFPIVYLDRFCPNLHFAKPQYFSDLRCTAVSGTGFIYLA